MPSGWKTKNSAWPARRGAMTKRTTSPWSRRARSSVSRGARRSSMAEPTKRAPGTVGGVRMAGADAGGAPRRRLARRRLRMGVSVMARHYAGRVGARVRQPSHKRVAAVGEDELAGDPAGGRGAEERDERG